MGLVYDQYNLNFRANIIHLAHPLATPTTEDVVFTASAQLNKKLSLWTQQTGKPHSLHQDPEHSHQQACLDCAVQTQGRGSVFVLQFSGRHPSG